jgi:hypothetical protein
MVEQPIENMPSSRTAALMTLVWKGAKYAISTLRISTFQLNGFTATVGCGARRNQPDHEIDLSNLHLKRVTSAPFHRTPGVSWTILHLL